MASDLADPRRILDIAFAFRRSMTLLTAVELGLFAALAEQPRKAKPLAQHLGLHGRCAEDFFDALVALGLLVRDTAGRYANTAESGQFLDPRKEDYIGHALHRVSTRVYGNWNSLPSALRTGQPQSGVFGVSGYDALYAEPRAQETFLQAMTGSSLTFARALAAAFPWQRYSSVVDIGSAEGCVPVQIARAHPHMIGGGFDLPAVEPWFTRYVQRHDLSHRLRFHAGDFHRDPLPSTEVMVMARVLHNWSLPVKKMLLSKAYEALQAGGALIICEHLIDDARKTGLDARFASMHMLIETADGSEATGAEYTGWLEDTGFREVRILQLECAQSAIVGEK
jgi:hypothetical protein